MAATPEECQYPCRRREKRLSAYFNAPYKTQIQVAEMQTVFLVKEYAASDVVEFLAAGVAECQEQVELISFRHIGQRPHLFLYPGPCRQWLISSLLNG